MLSLVFSLIGRILAWLINAYITVLFVRMILDWVSVLARNWYPRGVVAQLINIVYSITEPPLRWLRRYIRPLPLGSIYLDVSFIVLYFALVVLESCCSDSVLRPFLTRRRHISGIKTHVECSETMGS